MRFIACAAEAKGEGCGAKMAYLSSMMRFSLIAILLLVVGRASAQNDTIFPNVDGTWCMVTTTWVGDQQTGHEVDYTYMLQYQAEPSVEIDGLSWGSVTMNQGTQIGLIAVDQDKVLYRSVNDFYYGYSNYLDTATQVLYDFGLSVNDTAYWQPSTPAFPVIVQAIDTVWLGGRARKRFHFEQGDEWVAGIGSIKGLMHPFQHHFEAEFSMDCFCGNFVDADSVAYEACYPYSLSTGVAQLGKRTAIRPNPSTGTFTMEHVSPNKTYQLIDPRGIEILSGRTTGESTTIRIPNAVPGLYVLDVDGTRTKVIVQ